MTSKTRKRIWPVSLVVSIGIIGVLAAFVVLAANPVATQAHDPSGGETHDQRCDALDADGKADHDAAARDIQGAPLCGEDPGNGGNGGGGGGMESASTLVSSSTTGGASIKLTLTIENLPSNLNSGSWVEIYLEDDFQEPDSISRQDVVFIAMNADGTGDRATNDGGTVTAADVEIGDGGEIGNPDPTKDADEDAVVISARIPDMDPRDDYFGYPRQGQTLIMIVDSSAEIKNPTEETSNSTGYAIVGAGEDRGDVADMKLIDLEVKAEIALSDDDGGRGKEVTITGSGFNKGVDAEAFVLVKKTGDAPDCQTIIDDGDSLGTAGVGSDDKFAIVFTVHQDEFDPGEVNYICASDNESPTNRLASAVKVFDVTPSLTISPDSVSSGEEVTLKPRDFNSGTIEVSLDGDEDATYPEATGDDFEIEKDESNYVFDMPGGLSGVVQVSFKQGGDTKRGTITVDPSNLKLSKAEVAPNESVIVSGSGFSEDAEICVGDIKIDGRALKVDDAGTSADNSLTNGIDCDDQDKGRRYVSTTSNGAFTATVRIWSEDPETNPALDDDEYTIKVTDSEGFVGKAKITILEPTVSVMPEMVSPRDFITISGENWPISTADDDHEVTIMVDRRNRSVNIDGNGRFRYEYQLRSNIGIGDEHEVVVEFESDGGSIEEEATFEVHDAGIMLTPTEAAPGQTISLEIEGMPPYTLVDHVNIDGVNRLGGQNPNTDRHGNVMITGVLVPYLDPGFYPVEVMVGEETRVVQLEVLAEAVVAGAAAALPGAVEDLGDSLVRVFHFNTSSKVWTFYDPRPEFEGLNTLTELAAGQPYWILVSETQENVVLNGRPRDLTCVGGDCWNQLVW